MKRTRHWVFTGGKSAAMLPPPSASPASVLAPLIWLVQPPWKSPELCQCSRQRSENQNTVDEIKTNSFSDWRSESHNCRLFKTLILLCRAGILLGGCHGQRWYYPLERKKEKNLPQSMNFVIKQSVYSACCKGRLFHCPLYSGSTTIKASPPKALAGLQSGPNVVYAQNKPTVKARAP